MRALNCHEKEKSMSLPSAKAACCGFESSDDAMSSMSIGASRVVSDTGRNSPSTRINGYVPAVNSRSVPLACHSASSRESKGCAGGSAITEA
jgi:hypothetical protein